MTDCVIVASVTATRIDSRPEAAEATLEAIRSTHQEYGAELSAGMLCLPVVVFAAYLQRTPERCSSNADRLEQGGHSVRPFLLVVPQGQPEPEGPIDALLPGRFQATLDASTGLLRSIEPSPRQFGLLPISRRRGPLPGSQHPSTQRVGVWLSSVSWGTPEAASGSHPAFITVAPSEAGTK